MDRQSRSAVSTRPDPRFAPGRGRFVAIIAWILLCAAGPVAARAEDGVVRLTDAKESGAFNFKESAATLSRDGDAFRLDVTLPPGTAAGIFAKGLPAGLHAGAVDLIRTRVESDEPDVARSGLQVALEVKGTTGIQRVPLNLVEPAAEGSAARASRDEVPIQWNLIGVVTEVAIAVEQRPGAGPPMTQRGRLRLDVEFATTPWTRTLAESAVGRIGWALLAAGLTTAAWGLIGGFLRRGDARAGWSGGMRDLAFGLGLVATVGLGVAVFDFGARPAGDYGRYAPLGAILGAVLGGTVANLWSRTATGRDLSTAEWGRDAAITGFLAACSSPMAILQAPGSWLDALLLSQTAAATAVVAYHLANARRLATSGRHLGGITGGLIAATPFVFGALVLLSAGGSGLMAQLGDWVTFHGLGANAGAIREVAGRAVVLWLFNEAIAAALGLATRRRVSGSIGLHLTLLVASVAAVLAPGVADLGSGGDLVRWSGRFAPLLAIAAAAVSEAGLWAEVYLITGLLLDALAGFAPTAAAGRRHAVGGLGKAVVYAGVFMALLQGAGMLARWDGFARLAASAPWAVAIPLGVLAFPLIKTIIETFDGSQAFFRRLGRGYRDPVLYARGAVVGLGVGLAASLEVAGWSIPGRAAFGFLFGALAYAGVNLAAHAIEAIDQHGQVQPVRTYFVQAMLGGLIAAGLGFYFDGSQLAVVREHFWAYLAFDRPPTAYNVTPFLSKWGPLNLGTTTGGAKVLFDQSLAGVISWAIPAWLFAINRNFLAAYFAGETGPIRTLVTPDGRAALGRNMIEVLRWGLWMSPIIESFLRKMAEPTWYNQDGGIMTLVAIGREATEPWAAFRDWALAIFTARLAYNSVRALVWLDHFGLRVATLVNLSFLGMDRLDAKLARFLRPNSTARCIPEGVKRFTTWAPLLIPFYLPHGQDWDAAWDKSGAGHPPAVVTVGEPLLRWPLAWRAGMLVGLVGLGSAGFGAARLVGSRGKPGGRAAWTLSNPDYALTIEPSGAVTAEIKGRGYDLTRRSYDTLDPAGRALFLVADDAAGHAATALLGHFPGGGLPPASVVASPDSIAFARESAGIVAEVAVTLPDPDAAAELWTIRLRDGDGPPRAVALVPYLEWVLNRPDADRGHTQYNRLFAEMEYVPALNAVLAWDKHSKALGFVAADVAPSGFLTSRMDFVGRAGSLRAPEALGTMAFHPPEATEAHPTFDPIAALRIDLPANRAKPIRLLIGSAPDKAGAIALIARHLAIPGAADVASERRRKALHSIGHGAIPPGTPQPYWEFAPDGRTLSVLTPFTPRPVDHVLSNALGHVVALTNRGFQTTSSGNSQQNRITPDWSDTVTREVPPEAFYLFEPATGEWSSPTYHPLNDRAASYRADFGADGTATYHMTKGGLATELVVFVPPDQPAGIYHLTIRNDGNQERTFRVASYFQVVLAAQPEAAGVLKIRPDAKASALFFENPRNPYREGPAFAAVSAPPDAVETSRGRFFGPANDVTRPAFAADPKRSQPAAPGPDDRPVAAFANTLVVPPGGAANFTVVLGQSADRRGIAAFLRDLKDNPQFAASYLAATRDWWDGLGRTVRVETADPAFDRYLDWIKYQALAERIWARRGFYQASGAFGFRDQLQDSVNLIWMDPAIARRQIILHASQQFLEGDVVHWFHRLGDGRTGFAARTHASDNLLWLSWAVVDYVAATGDLTLLDETTPYLEAELPFGPLPKDKGGMGFDPLRSARADTVYRHCLKAIDLVLERRMGAHGLPLIGTGDWNDGLDEIGAEGKGESVWLGFFLHYILKRMAPIIGAKEGEKRQDHYLKALRDLGEALESTWRDDRYLRAIHDDGTEIGVKGSGVWEIDALTAAWAVMADINPLRGRVVFETALEVLEKDTTILLGWPPLREDTHPYLGRSSGYPEGVRENGMYCHGVQWLVGAARLLAEAAVADGRPDDAARYAATAHRLWSKVASILHTDPAHVETFGGQPNKQSADMVTTFDPGRMIWHGYTGAAGWMFRQALEGVLGLRLIDGAVLHPAGQPIALELGEARVARDITGSPFAAPVGPTQPSAPVTIEATR